MPLVLKFIRPKLPHMEEFKQLKREKDFKEGVEAFESRKCGTQNAGRNQSFYQGWTWAWGRSDGLQGSACLFPHDADYTNGYLSGTGELVDEVRIHPSVFTAKAF